jgi:hypothetical protein
MAAHYSVVAGWTLVKEVVVVRMLVKEVVAVQTLESGSCCLYSSCLG